MSVLIIALVVTVLVAAFSFLMGPDSSGEERTKKLGKRGKVKVYHGTRLPMSLIVEQGIPSLSLLEREELLNQLCKRYSKVLGRKVLSGFRSPREGVFVTDKFVEAQFFALMAPAAVSDGLYEVLGFPTDGDLPEKVDSAILGLLDKMGSPKVLECIIPGERFLVGDGKFGSSVNGIRPEEIQRVHLISYPSRKADAERRRLCVGVST